MKPLEEFDQKAAAVVGMSNFLTSEHDKARFIEDWRGRYKGRARAVIRPKNTAEVAAIMVLAREAGVRVVPQSGNTGLVGGAIPDNEETAIVLNLSRMRKIRKMDQANNSVTVEAGLILAELHDLATKNDRMFPINLGAVGSAQIGGLISTNAGGTEVLRYGNMREQVLGLEVVLPDGRIWNGLRGLRKDNSGYDLKQLFIGSEGTLGIVTAAVLKLRPRQKAATTAMISVRDPAAATRLLGDFYDCIGSRVESFELISRSQIQIVLRHRPDFVSPMALENDWYAIIEISDSTEMLDLSEAMETVLSAGLETGDVIDAVIAQDLTQSAKIWEIRHSISEANKSEGFTVSNDTSVPVSAQPKFLQEVSTQLHHHYPKAILSFCGHMGDGNVHVIVIFPHGTFEPQAKEALALDVNRIVHLKCLEFEGSIAAEHGIGQMHVQRLRETKCSVALDLMKAIKGAIDPENMMNPGKVLVEK